jgi:hypothetical protein
MMGKFDEKRMENQFKRQRREKGYADCDVWEMRTWFVNTARPILIEMSEKVDNHPDELEFEQWRETIKRMAHLLVLMDIWDDSTLRKELNINEDDKTADATALLNEKRREAKDEFFSLFNKWFYDLWF